MTRTRKDTHAKDNGALSEQSDLKGVQKKRAPSQRKPKTDTPKGTAVFKYHVQIGDHDFLSQLPTDCLDNIFTRLNQDDLDTLSELNQTIHAATLYSRPRAAKARALNLTLVQNTMRRTCGVITFSDLHQTDVLGRPYHRKYAITLNYADSAAKMIQKFTNQGTQPPAPDVALKDLGSAVPDSKVVPVRRNVMNYLLPTLHRFTFDRFLFKSIGIDDEFLSDFTKLISKSLQSLTFDCCTFDDNFGHEGKTRLLSFLIAAKPANLILDFTRAADMDIFDLSFIRRYADAMDHPKLTFLDRNYGLSGDFQIPTTAIIDLLPCLNRFDVLRVPWISVTPEQLLDMILNRLMTEDFASEWVFATSGIFTNELISRIDRSKYTYTIDLIKKKTTHFGAKIHFMRNYYRPLSVVVRFRQYYLTFP